MLGLICTLPDDGRIGTDSPLSRRAYPCAIGRNNRFNPSLSAHRPHASNPVPSPLGLVRAHPGALVGNRESFRAISVRWQSIPLPWVSCCRAAMEFVITPILVNSGQFAMVRCGGDAPAWRPAGPMSDGSIDGGVGGVCFRRGVPARLARVPIGPGVRWLRGFPDT